MTPSTVSGGGAYHAEKDRNGTSSGQGLVLSLFPGIGLLDMAFEEEGFCVVRGPDLLWGGDVRRFHPPAGRFDGVIGGPPCQAFSGLANFAHRWKVQPEDLIGEWERCVREAAPSWALMENVPGAPIPDAGRCGMPFGWEELVNNRHVGGIQDRARRFTFLNRGFLALHIQPEALEPFDYGRTVTSAHGGARQRMRGTIQRPTVERALELTGLPADFFGHNHPFTTQGKLKTLAQGVPLPLGRAVARAVKLALSRASEAA